LFINGESDRIKSVLYREDTNYCIAYENQWKSLKKRESSWCCKTTGMQMG